MEKVETWKAFSENEITHSGAHYLMAIHDLIKGYGYARVSDVARHLAITRGSTSLALKALRERGLVIEDHNKFLGLSEEGQTLAESIESRRHILIKFLRDALQVDEDQAEIDACKMEHLISEETSQRMLHFLQFLFSEERCAKGFLARFYNADPQCTSLDGCPVCQEECLFDGASQTPPTSSDPTSS